MMKKMLRQLKKMDAAEKMFGKEFIDLITFSEAKDEYTGIIRTPFRYYTDSVTVLSGFSSGIIRTAF